MSHREFVQSIIKFFTYEQLKRRLEAETKSGLLPAHRQQLATGVAGGSSACTAAFFSHAFDTIKTRIMTGSASSGRLLAVASSIWREEGAAAFFLPLPVSLEYFFPAVPKGSEPGGARPRAPFLYGNRTRF